MMNSTTKKMQSFSKNNALFKCDKCPYSTNIRKALILHQNRHKGPKPFCCHLCPYSSAYMSDLYKHLRGRHQIEPLTRRQLSTEAQVFKVGEDFPPPNPAVSEVTAAASNDVAASRSGNSRKSKLPPNKTFSCQFCTFKTKYKTNLRVHEKTQHQTSSDVICKECGKTFKNSESLRKHMLSHRKERFGAGASPGGTGGGTGQGGGHQCPRCSFVASARSGLHRHMQEHLMEEGELEVEGDQPAEPGEMAVEGEDQEPAVGNGYNPEDSVGGKEEEEEDEKGYGVVADDQGKTLYACHYCSFTTASHLNISTHLDLNHEGQRAAARPPADGDTAYHRDNLWARFESTVDGQGGVNPPEQANGSGQAAKDQEETGPPQPSRSAASHWHLNEHVRKHSTQYSYSCRNCGKPFKYRRSLQGHQKSCQADGPAKPVGGLLHTYLSSQPLEKNDSSVFPPSNSSVSPDNENLGIATDRGGAAGETNGRKNFKPGKVNRTVYMDTDSSSGSFPVDSYFSCPVCSKQFQQVFKLFMHLFHLRHYDLDRHWAKGQLSLSIQLPQQPAVSNSELSSPAKNLSFSQTSPSLSPIYPDKLPSEEGSTANPKPDLTPTNTPKKPFICPICGFACTHKGNLTNHLRRHNKKPQPTGKKAQVKVKQEVKGAAVPAASSLTKKTTGDAKKQSKNPYVAITPLGSGGARSNPAPNSRGAGRDSALKSRQPQKDLEEDGGSQYPVIENVYSLKAASSAAASQPSSFAAPQGRRSSGACSPPLLPGGRGQVSALSLATRPPNDPFRSIPEVWSKSAAALSRAKETRDGQVLMDKSLMCQYCNIMFPDMLLFTIHMGWHAHPNNPFQCGVCSFQCKDKFEFTCHFSRGHVRN